MRCAACKRPAEPGRKFCTGCGAATPIAGTEVEPRRGASPLPTVRPRRLPIVIDDSDLLDAPAPLAVRAGPPLPPALRLPPPGPPPSGPLSRRRLAAGGGVLGLLVLAGLAIVLLHHSGDTSRQIVASRLQFATAITQRSGMVAGDARTLADLRRAGRGAQTATRQLDAEVQALRAVDDARLRAVAISYLQSQRSYLSALGELTALDRAAAADPDLPVWKRPKVRLDAAVAALGPPLAAVTKAAVPGRVAIDAAALLAATAGVDDTLRQANHKLAAWQAKLDAYEQRERVANRRSRDIVAYRDHVRAAVAAYRRGRERVGRFVAVVNGYTYDDAQQHLTEFQQDRQQTIELLGAITPPDAVSVEHQGLVDPVEASIGGLGEALRAVEEGAELDDPVTAQSSWSDFRESSKQIDAELTTADGVWEQAVEHQRALVAGDIGRRPAAPAV